MPEASPPIIDRRYELIEVLGEGSGGLVHLARDTLEGGRLVALKEMRSTEPEAIEYFISEFALLSGLKHPCLVETYDYGGGGDGPRYFTMEYVPGGTLLDRTLPLPLPDAYAVTTALLEALVHLHDAACVHFDLKPSNVLLSGGALAEPGAVKLADFGLSGGPGRTRGLRGTPAFAAPELIRSEHADGRADLYSLGALLYWMMTGRPPFSAAAADELLRLHVEEAPRQPSLHRHDLPEPVERFILRLLAKNPASRFDSARSAAAAFAQAAGLAPVAWGTPRRAPFVGRQRELALLRHALDALSDPSSQRAGIHLITGEAGVGKTRLVDELRVLCQTRDVPFLGTSVSAEGRAPLAGLRALLPQLLAFAGDLQIPDEPTTDLPDIVIRAAAISRRPFVLFLDDLEGADAPTVDAVRALARAAAEGHMSFLLLAAIGEEGADNRKLAETLYILHSEEVAVDIALAALREDEILELVRGRFGPQAGTAELAHRILREVGGLPLVVTTALEFLASSGTLSLATELDAPILAASGLKLEGLPLPETLRDAVRHRLDELSPATRDLMTLLAINRSPLPALELATIAGIAFGKIPTSDETAIALSSAAVAHVARTTGTPAHPLWEVASAVVRNVLLRQLPEEELLRLHRVLAQHIAESGGPVEEVAYHAIAGEDGERAAQAAAVTGRRFLQLEDHARAREFLQAAVQLETEPVRRTSAALDLATALQKIGDNAALRAVLTEIDPELLAGADRGRVHLLVGSAEMGDRNIDAARAAFAAAASAATGEDLITAHSNLGLLSMRTGDMDGFRGHLDRIFEIAQASKNPEHEAQALTVRGHFHRVSGELERAREDYGRSVELLAPRGPSILLRQAYHHLAWISGFLEDDKEAMEYYRRSNAVAMATGVIGDLARSHRGLGYQHLARGDIDVAERHLQRALEINDRFGGTERGYIFMGLAHVHLERCDYRECQRRLEEARAEGARDQHAGLLAEVGVFRARLAIALGDPAATAIAREAAAFFERLGDQLSWDSTMVLGLAQHQQHDPASVETLREALARATRAHRKDGVARCLASLIDALPQGDPERRRATLQLVAFARETGQPPHQVIAAVAAARVTETDGDLSLALEGGETVSVDQLLTASLATARQAPQPEAVWRLESFLASRCLARADLQRAGTHVRSAYTTLEEIWRQLPEEAGERYLQLPDQLHVRGVIRRYNQLVRTAQEGRSAEAPQRAQASFALEEPAPAPRSADGSPSHMPTEAFQSRQPRRRLAAFYEVSRRISAIREQDRLLSEVLNLAIAELDADRGIVFLVTENGELTPRVRRDLEAAAARDAGEFSRRLVDQVGTGSPSVLLADAQAAAGGDPAATALRYGISSLMCVPMRSPARLVGTIYVDSRRSSRHFSEADLEFLAAFADLAAVAIENALHCAQQDEEIEELRRRVAGREGLERIAGASESHRRVLGLAKRAAGSDVPVFITGETGTGKELLARAIHSASARAEGPLVVVDCTTLPPGLAESELFGHVAGAFTNAHESRDGLLTQAHGGTVFIDEIGDLPLPQQGALLRFLQEGELRPVGSASYRKVSARVISATHRDLEQMVAQKAFRQDLFYRINVISIRVAPLRERRDDIPFLVEHFLGQLARQEGRRLKLTPKALKRLTHHDWPGNVRELENALRAAVVLARGGVIDEDAFELVLRPTDAPEQTLFDHERSLNTESRRQPVQDALQRAAGQPKKAAELLGISLRTLYRRCQELGLEPQDFRPPARRAAP